MKYIPLLLGLLPIHHIMAQDKPNVVFIFADDMTIDALDNCPDRQVKTPNLDRLKSQGVFFENSFNQGGWSGAISAASRAMLNTGRYLWKAAKAETGQDQMFKNLQENWPSDATPYKREIVPQKEYWAEAMHRAGYKTYMTGKWHVIKPAQKVFQVTKDIRPGMPGESMDYYERKFIKGHQDEWTPFDKSKGGYWQGGKHWSEVVCDDALEFIADAKSQSKPFFMYLAFNAPHDPRQSPKKFIDMYPPENIRVPKNFAVSYPYQEQIGCGPSLRDAMVAPFPRTTYSCQVNKQEYYALITHLDVQVGKILDALEKSGKIDNTYIFFTADHGLCVGEHSFFGKQNMYDQSMRVPLIVKGPNIKGGRNLHNMIYLQDVMASVLDIAGSDALNKVDFKSLLPLVEGKTTSSRKAVYGAYLGLQRMVRTDRYKMIVYPTINVVRLYDLKNDPLEMNDIAKKHGSKKITDKLLIQFKELQKEVGDQLDITPYYNKFYKG